MNKGGRYIVNDKGERELIECTKPAERKPAEETSTHANDATKRSGTDANAEPPNTKTGTGTSRSSGDDGGKSKHKGK